MDKRLKTKGRKGLYAEASRYPKVVKKLKAMFLQGGKWYRVGDILR